MSSEMIKFATAKPKMDSFIPSEGNDSLTGTEIYDIDELRDDSTQKALTFACSLLMISFCIVGAFGNIASAIIFTQRCMRSSINVLLTGLSFIDLAVLVIAIPVFAIPGLNAYEQLGPLGSLQKAVVFGLYQLAVIAQTCSAYMFVLITIERYFAVCHPLRVQRLFTIRRANIAQMTVFGLSVLYNLCRFWEYKMVRDEDGSVGYVRSLRAHPGYFLGYYTSMYLLVHFIIPFTIIPILNWRIAVTIKVATTIRSKLTMAQKCDNPRQRQVTRMIIVVTAVFAGCNMMAFCLSIWEAISPASFRFHINGHLWHSFTAYVFTEISNVLIVLNSSVNFIIYLVYCRKYRRLFEKFFLGMCCRRRMRPDNETSEGRSQPTIGLQQLLNVRRSSSPRASDATLLVRRFTIASHSVSGYSL